MKHIVPPSLSITYAKIKCTFLRKTYSCICGLQAYDDKYVLSQTQKWVIRDLLHNNSMKTKMEKAHYIIHKCEVHGLSMAECMFLLNIFDFHLIDDFFDVDCGCDICNRLKRYKEAG